MEKIITTLGAFIFSWLGWWIGAQISIMTAFMVSMVGTGFGIYAGRRVTRHYLG